MQNDDGRLREIFRRMPLHWQLLFAICCVVGLFVWGRVNLIRGGIAMLLFAAVNFLMGYWGMGIIIICWVGFAFFNNLVLYQWILRWGQTISSKNAL
jgi:hypothetical protein